MHTEVSTEPTNLTMNEASHRLIINDAKPLDQGFYPTTVAFGAGDPMISGYLIIIRFSAIRYALNIESIIIRSIFRSYAPAVFARLGRGRTRTRDFHRR